MYFSYRRLLIYILYTLENLAGHPLLAGTDTAIVVVFILHVRIRRRPEFVDGVAECLLSPVPECLDAARFWRDAPRLSVRSFQPVTGTPVTVGEFCSERSRSCALPRGI